MSGAPARIALRLLGPVQIEHDDEIIRKIGSQKSIALLGYLVQQGQPLSRTTLAGLLWPDQAETEGRRNLRWALNNLTNLLPNCFVADRHTIHFLPVDHAWIDTRTFETLLAQDDDNALAAASELYRSEFLAGLTLDDCPELELWLLQEREAWRRRVLSLLERLSERQLRSGDYPRAEATLQRLLELEPWHETAHRQLLWLLAVTGRRTAALAQYEICCRILAEELAADPLPETVALYEQIRDDKLENGRLTIAEWQLLAQQSAPPETQSSIVNRQSFVDWGEAPTSGAFYGREEEVAQLTQWLTTAQARLVGIFGMGGMGKTTLAATVARTVCDAFTCVIWRSLLNAPPLADILHTWVDLLTDHRLPEWPERLDDQLRLLFAQLRNQRCLLVLDNFESILQDRERAGEYRSGYEAYGQLLEQMGMTEHQSCLLLTSREQPPGLTHLVSGQTPIYLLPLGGLDLNAGRVLLGERGLAGTVAGEVALVMRTSGSPLALKLVAETIRDLFDSNIAHFLSDETFIFDDIRDVLDAQFVRLPRLEQDLLLWLAIEREELPPQQLQQNLAPPVSKREFLEALRSLQRRSLLEKGANGFTLQNVVIEFATGYLIDTIGRELLNATPDRLKSHALMKAGAKEYLRQSQARLILTPILEGVMARLGEKAFLHQIRHLLEQLRTTAPVGHYAGGNLLNLLLTLEIDLSNYDFSALPIWQAYLRQAELAGVNFRGADFAHTIFADTFGLVHCVALNPNGQEVVATAGHEIRCWRRVDGQSTYALRGHTDDVWSVAFSPDGEQLVSGSWDRTVRLWEISTGNLLRTLYGHAKGVVTVAFSPDGRTITSGGYDHTIRLWDALTGECLHLLEGHNEWVWGVAFSPDGGLLASASGDRTIRLWKVRDGEHLATLTGHGDQVWSVAFSPDGRLLASGGNDGNVLLWDMRTRQVVQVLRGHTNWVRSVAFAPTGEMVASGSNDGTVRLWHTQSGQTIHVLRGHLNAVNTVHFGPAGQVLASGSNDQSVRVWDLLNGRPLHIVYGYTNWVRAVTFSQDGQWLAGGGDDGKLRLYHVGTGTLHKTFTGHTQMVRAVSVSPDGRLLATASADRTARIWDIERGKVQHILRDHTNWISSVAFSVDGRLLATSSWDETIRLWEVESGQLVQTLRGHQRAVYDIVFIPTPPAVAGIDYADVDLHENGWPASAIAEATHYLLASGSSDHTVRLWDALTGKTLAVLTGHTDVVRTVACSDWREGRPLLLASGCEDGTVSLWAVDPRTGHTQLQRSCHGHTKGVRSVTVSNDGALVISGGDDHTVRLWDGQSGALLHTLAAHKGVVWSVACRYDGRTLASGSADETIRLWSVAAAHRPVTLYRTLRTPGPYAAMDITGATGLMPAQMETLKRLGAIEQGGDGQANQPSIDVASLDRSKQATIPHNLPRQPAPLVGRTAELKQLVQLIGEATRPLITLLGPGGVGKTRLALAAAQAILDGSDAFPENPPSAIRHQDFPDGLWFVPLAGLDGAMGQQRRDNGDQQAAVAVLEDQVAAAIADAVGLRLTGNFIEGRSLKQQLFAYLRPKRLLLLLDNFEHLLEGAWLVSELLAEATGVQMVATSRTPLNLQEESRFPVRYLSLPYTDETQAALDPQAWLAYDSVALFVQCAQRFHYEFHLDEENWRAVLQICQAVDGLPLAIELAATWLEGMSCAEIAEELRRQEYNGGDQSSGLDFLTTNLRNVPQRHQKLRTVFAASWRLLTEREQQGAAQLSLFRGGCERAAALAVTMLRLPELNSLLAKSILQRDEQGRVQMHELLRQFAAEQLAEQAQSQPETVRLAHERHSHFYLDLLCTLDPQVKSQAAPEAASLQGGALAQVRRELDNLRQAWHWAVAQGELSLLTRTLSPLVRLYTFVGLFDEGRRLMASTVERLRTVWETVSADRRPLTAFMSRLYTEQANFCNSQARYAEAMTAIQSALAWLEQRANPEQAAGAYLRWAEALWYQGDITGARPHLAQAWRLLQQASPPLTMEQQEIEADLRCTRGGIAVRQGEYTTAAADYEASLALSRQLDDGRRVSRALHSLGTLWRNQAQYAQARGYLEQGLQLARQMGDLHGEGRALNSLGDIALYLGEYEPARRSYQAVLTIARRAGDRRSEGIALTNLGIVARELGQFAEAQTLLTAAIAHAQTIHFARGEGWGCCCLSLLHSQQQEYRQSLEVAQRALQIFDQLDDRLGQAFAQANRGRALAGQGQWAAALTAFTEALLLRQELQQAHFIVEVRGGLAQVALAQGHSAAATAHVDAILTYLADHPLYGIELPAQLYAICYDVLRANQDHRATTILQTAQEFLTTRANGIQDPALRHAFLQQIPAHAALLHQA
ncbi:MAG: tetratricopeptide repeat protein [Caldilineaceae bacterium]